MGTCLAEGGSLKFSGWDAFIQWALTHIRTFRPQPNNILAGTEDGVAAINPEHPPPPTTADGAASVQSPENQLGGGATMVPMVAVKDQGGASLLYA